MKVSEKNKIIEYLIENSEFSTWNEDDKASLEALPPGALRRTLGLTEKIISLNAAAQEEEIEDDEEEETPPPKKTVTNKKVKKIVNDDHEDGDEESGATGQTLPSGKKVKGKGGKNTGDEMGKVLKTAKSADGTKEAITNEDAATAEEVIGSIANPEIRRLLTNGLQVARANHEKLVSQVMNHKNNPYSEEWLRAQEDDVLEGMVRLSGGARPILYTGNGNTGPAPLRNEDHTEEPLATPSMSWEVKNA